MQTKIKRYINNFGQLDVHINFKLRKKKKIRFDEYYFKYSTFNQLKQKNANTRTKISSKQKTTSNSMITSYYN